MTEPSEDCPYGCERAKPDDYECPDCGAEMQPDDSAADEQIAQGAEIDARAEITRGGW